MGARFNWKFRSYWVEWTPFVYLRINKKSEEGCWYIKYESWNKRF